LKNALAYQATELISAVISFMTQAPGVYPRGKHMKGAPLGQAPALLTNIGLGWKGLSGSSTLVYFASSQH